MMGKKDIERWCAKLPLLRDMIDYKPVSWFNHTAEPPAEILEKISMGKSDVQEASLRLHRFRPFIAKAFGETSKTDGIIESPLVPIPELQKNLSTPENGSPVERLFLKGDHSLAVSGSIKARGGVYSVLKHAERLALDEGLLKIGDDYSLFDSVDFQQFLNTHTLIVGSTGCMSSSHLRQIS